jgi:Spy/CpxP family protein refolding chaperone
MQAYHMPTHKQPITIAKFDLTDEKQRMPVHHLVHRSTWMKIRSIQREQSRQLRELVRQAPRKTRATDVFGSLVPSDSDPEIACMLKR